MDADRFAASIGALGAARTARAGGRPGRRVLVTADTIGGVWQFAMELCRGLAEAGDAVALATMGAMLRPDQRSEAQAIPGLRLYPSRHRLEWMDAPWEEVDAAGDWLLEVAREVQPDVVHLNQFAFGALDFGAPVLLTGHSCVLSWWRAVHGCDAPPEWREYQLRVQAGLRAADLVVAPTRAMLEALELHYGPLPPARVIANGRSGRGLPPVKDAQIVLAAGRIWDEGKNLAALAAVAPQLPWPVCIAGEGCHPDGGRNDLPNVRLLGRLPDGELQPWFARAPVYALPARYEPFGLSALEAALAGCALVLGDIPSLREVWGDAALYVAPGDEVALRVALQHLIEDAAQRELLAARALVRARRYSAEAMVRDYRRAHDDVASARTPTAPVQPSVPARPPAGGLR